MPISQENLKNWFRYHQENEAQIVAISEICAKALELAELVLQFTPSCADQSVSIRNIREAVMNAQAAILCGGR